MTIVPGIYGNSLNVNLIKFLIIVFVKKFKKIEQFSNKLRIQYESRH